VKKTDTGTGVKTGAGTGNVRLLEPARQRRGSLCPLASAFREDGLAALLDLMWTAKDEKVRLAAAVVLAEWAEGRGNAAKAFLRQLLAEPEEIR